VKDSRGRNADADVALLARAVLLVDLRLGRDQRIAVSSSNVPASVSLMRALRRNNCTSSSAQSLDLAAQGRLLDAEPFRSPRDVAFSQPRRSSGCLNSMPYLAGMNFALSHSGSEIPPRFTLA
jgi:hypothetical protein